jgi:hypothetical protein
MSHVVIKLVTLLANIKALGKVNFTFTFTDMWTNKLTAARGGDHITGRIRSGLNDAFYLAVRSELCTCPTHLLMNNLILLSNHPIKSSSNDTFNEKIALLSCTRNVCLR